ncbi:peroxidase P7 [Beta vulgaris subsp. vulgaris]|uniref:peroxidase P7 n=1 Tax=Beta vulgaris subsp. vulgaris TaxID=3555 RepID=UPI0020371F51|nr:peroxidase P7 [Beta vulgaris subsp. vulgaris]
MGSSSTYFFAAISLIWLLMCASSINAQLTPTFYAKSCPKLLNIVRATMAKSVAKEPRIGASILRLFFHDCFVNGCDASVLLEDTPTFKGEKNAYPNQNSLRGFKLMDILKRNVEAICKATVSCSDILALAARDSVVLLGGPSWTVPLGRKDTRTASESAANANLPPATANLATLISLFASKNLTARDMTALSGAHTIGMARCTTFRSRIYNEANSINATFATSKMATCPSVGGDNNLAPLDMSTSNHFDNGYFKTLMAKQGLLHSDQELFNGGSQDAWVRLYAKSNYAFAQDFVAAMVKMGNISPLTGFNGEIRKHCRFLNQ